MRDYNIALILKTGGDYDLSDVNLLTLNIHKYWEGETPVNIFCFTDVVTERVETKHYTLLPLINPEWNGWWSKMNLFNCAMRLYRPFLYLDLDTMVVGDLSKTFFPTDEEAFITLENIGEYGRMGSGVMQVPNHPRIREVWQRWIKAPARHSRIHRGDQDFIQYVTRAHMYWQGLTTRITSAKPGFKMLTEKPENVDIIYFHGYPRIPEAVEKYKWVKNYVDGTY